MNRPTASSEPILLRDQDVENGKEYDGDFDDDDGDDDDNGLQAHSHHDKFPPWWVFVRDDYGGNLSVTKSHH